MILIQILFLYSILNNMITLKKLILISIEINMTHINAYNTTFQNKLIDYQAIMKIKLSINQLHF